MALQRWSESPLKKDRVNDDRSPHANTTTKTRLPDRNFILKKRCLAKVNTVLEIGPEKMAHYRKILAGVAVTDDRKNDMIRAVGSLMQSFVDRAWGVDPIQILERSRLKDSFQSATLHASLPSTNLISDSAERVDLGPIDGREGATTQSKKKRGWRHGQKPNHEGGNILPHI